MEQPRTVPMDASFFECAFCGKPMKPPTFNCDAGHVVCQSCRDGHLQVCTDAVNKRKRSCLPCPVMDRALRAAMPHCVHNNRGCTVRVAYHESADHLRSCDFVPCRCPSRERNFTASPAAMLEHFSNHEWRVVRNYVYGQPCKLTVPRHWWSMVALVGESDRRVFLVYGSRLDNATAVSVVCLRASEDAPAVARQFHCQLKGVKGGGTNSFSFRVPSCDGRRLPGPAEQGMFLAVPELPLRAALMIRIHKDGGEAGSSDEDDGGSGDESAGSSDEDEGPGSSSLGVGNKVLQ